MRPAGRLLAVSQVGKLSLQTVEKMEKMGVSGGRNLKRRAKARRKEANHADGRTVALSRVSRGSPKAR